MNTSVWRKDFPIFSEDQTLVYLDTAATSQKPFKVIESLSDFYTKHNANVHRGLYKLSAVATAQYEGARKKVAAFIGAESPENIIFTRSATEAVNLVASAWAALRLKQGDQIIVSALEHHSNLVPWLNLASTHKIEVVIWKTTSDGLLKLEDLQTLVTDKTRLVAFSAMSNVLSTKPDVAGISAYLNEKKIVSVVDAAQAMAHRSINVQEWKVDFLVVSSHKIYGPSGIGALYYRPDRGDEMGIYQSGGDMILSVSYDSFTVNEKPYRWEAGTPAAADAIGFGAALDYLTSNNFSHVIEYEDGLGAYLYESLRKINKVTVYGPTDMAFRGPLASFNVEGVHPHDVASFLDSLDIAIRAGHHCAMPLTKSLGLMATNRASLGMYNQQDEIDRLCAGLQKVLKLF